MNFVMSKMWPTNVLFSDMEEKKDIFDYYTNYILENFTLESNSGEINDSNIFSDKKFDNFIAEIVNPCFDFWLKESIGKTLSYFKNRKYKGWVTGAQNGYNMLTHNHNGAHLSGVFYLMNDDVKSGKIIFFDPRTNCNRGYNDPAWNECFKHEVVDAKPYSSVIFPSFLYHQVTNFNGKIRLAIPVDLYL